MSDFNHGSIDANVQAKYFDRFHQKIETTSAVTLPNHFSVDYEQVWREQQKKQSNSLEYEYSMSDLAPFAKRLKQIFPGNYEFVMKWSKDPDADWIKEVQKYFNEALKNMKKDDPIIEQITNPKDLPRRVLEYFEKKAKERKQKIQEEDSEDFYDMLENKLKVDGPDLKIGKVGNGFGFFIGVRFEEMKNISIPEIIRNKFNKSKTLLGAAEILYDFMHDIAK
jgi:hypothetical protein